MDRYRLLNITYEDFVRAAENKRCILFGAGSTCLKVIKDIHEDVNIDYIVDSDFWKWGSLIGKYEVKQPNALWKENREDIVVLVTAVSFSDIEKILIEEGFYDNYYSYTLFFERIVSKYDYTTLHISGLNA